MTPAPATSRTALVTGALVLAASSCRFTESDVGHGLDDSLKMLTESPIHSELALPDPEPWDERDEEVVEVIESPVARIAGDELWTFQLRGAALAEAIHMIAEQAGVNIYLDAALDARVDASFPGVTLDTALQTILQRNGLALFEDPPGVYAVRVEDGSQAATGSFVLRSVLAVDVAEHIQGLVDANTKVVIDANQNLVLVQGQQSEVDLVAQYLDLADRLKSQVLIEVGIFEARIDENFEFGSTFQADAELDGDTASLLQNLSTPSDAFSLTLTGGDLTAKLNAVRRYIGLELVSSPRVLAITNTESMIEVVSEVPYINVTSTTETDAGGISVLEQVEFKEVGIKLAVTPTVQESGILQIKVDQSLSEVVDVFNGIPVLDTRQLVSQFLVADRETIVLGGLMQDRRQDTDEGVPVLMHVPFLGRLFRKDEDRTEKSELLVFLTPRVLDPREASQLAERYQHHYRAQRKEMLEAVRAD